MACGPAHDDGKPSLSVREGDGGKVLLHYFAGCRTDHVLGTLGLGFSHLDPAKSMVVAT